MIAENEKGNANVKPEMISEMQTTKNNDSPKKEEITEEKKGNE